MCGYRNLWWKSPPTWWDVNKETVCVRPCTYECSKRILAYIDETHAVRFPYKAKVLGQVERLLLYLSCEASYDLMKWWTGFMVNCPNKIQNPLCSADESRCLCKHCRYRWDGPSRSTLFVILFLIFDFWLTYPFAIADVPKFKTGRAHFNMGVLRQTTYPLVEICLTKYNTKLCVRSNSVLKPISENKTPVLTWCKTWRKGSYALNKQLRSSSARTSVQSDLGILC